MDDIDQLLARLRKEKGLSQVALGKLAGTTGKYNHDIECRKHGVIVALSRVAAALDVSLERVYAKHKNRKEQKS